MGKGEKLKWLLFLIPFVANSNIVKKEITNETLNNSEVISRGTTINGSRYSWEVHATCVGACTGNIYIGYSDSLEKWAEILEVQRPINGTEEFLFNIVNAAYSQTRLRIESTNAEDMVINAWYLSKDDK